MGAIYGYIMAEPDDIERRKKQMLDISIPAENLYIDCRTSGRALRRKQFAALTSVMKMQDVLYIRNFDDLGYTYDEIIEQWNLLVNRIRADIALVELPLVDTRWRRELVGSYVSDIVLSILGYEAEKRRDVHEKQRRGIEEARRKGISLGRPRKTVPDNFEAVCDEYLAGGMTLQKASSKCGIPQSTFRQWLKQYHEMTEKADSGDEDSRVLSKDRKQNEKIPEAAMP